MKAFTPLTILAYLAYQASALPVTATRAVETAEDLTPLGYIYWSKRAESEALARRSASATPEEAEDLTPLGYICMFGPLYLDSRFSSAILVHHCPLACLKEQPLTLP